MTTICLDSPPNLCPSCRSNSINRVRSDEKYIEVICRDCGLEWTNIYDFHHTEIEIEPEKIVLTQDQKDRLALCHTYIDPKRCVGNRLVHSKYCCLHCGSDNPSGHCDFKEKDDG